MAVQNVSTSRAVPPGSREGLRLGVIGIGIVAFFLLITFFTSYYTIEAESVGVVTRFGRFKELALPGLHFKLPLGVDNVQSVPIQRQEKAEFGFRTTSAGIQSQYDTSTNYHDESLMVTGDLNAAVVEWSVQYRVHDPEAYVFHVRNPEGTLRYASESVMREVVGDHTVDEILTVMRQKVADEAQVRLQKLMDEYKMGIRIDRIVLQDVTPPPEVQPAFSQVNGAQQERERSINDARAEYNKVVPRARGEAQQQIQAAQGYALQRVNEAQGDAERFNAIFAEYLKAPEATRRRMYLETMTQVLPRLGRKFIIDEQAKSVLPLLPLGGAGLVEGAK